MRPGLRAKILLLTAPPLVALSAVALWMVHQSVDAQAHRTVHEDLRRAAAVFENMLAARANELAVAGAVIVRDPKFFAVLSLPGSSHEPMFRATVAGVATDFNRITHADLFEITDTSGGVIATVGRHATSPEASAALVQQALAGQPASGVIAERGAHWQAVVTPVFAHDRVIGALLLGQPIGPDLAMQLRELTRTEVTFLSGDRTTGTTLSDESDHATALAATRALAKLGPTTAASSSVEELRGAGNVWLTFAGRIPGTEADAHQYYVLQRALGPETAFLREIRDHLIEFGLLAALLTVIAALVIASRITDPVRRMVHAAQRMEQGDWEVPLEVRGRDEIAHLATRFADMRARIRQHVSSLTEVARMKSEFIAVAGHELRTPISVIRGFHELMRDGMLGPISTEQGRALDAIGRSVRTLSRIAEDATRMAQIHASELQLDLQECELGPVLEAALRDAREAAPDRAVTLEARVEPGGEYARLDPARLGQALGQLVRNGVRFTPDGGQVLLRSRGEGDAIVVEVRDTGIGIPEDRRRTLFEHPHTRSDSIHHHSSSTLEFNSAGLGLGLQIARGIIEAHAGSIEVASEIGHGSTFTVRLPGARLSLDQDLAA